MSTTPVAMALYGILRMLCGFGILAEGAAIATIDGTHALGSIGAAAGENDADCVRALIFRERFEEAINGIVRLIVDALNQAQDAVLDY